MKRLTCEMCGSNDLIKQEGSFVCQMCGCKYSVEEAKKMMIEGTVEVQGTVQVDASNQKENLLKRAEIAIEDKKFGDAENFANRTLDIDAECVEAYEVLLLCAMKSSYKQLLLFPRDISKNKNYAKIKKFGSQELIDKYDQVQSAYYEAEYQKAIALYNSPVLDTSVKCDIEIILRPLYYAGYKDSKEIYSKIEDDIAQVKKDLEGLEENCYSFTYGGGFSIGLYKEGYVIISSTSIGTKTFNFWDIRKLEIENDGCNWSATIKGKESINRADSFALVMCEYKDWSVVKKALKEIVDRVKISGNTNFSTNLATGEEKASSGGCYVATCVYGSYDCPEVWTLRRYRDDTLGSTWYGRTFIKLYYAISPTIVKWFGETKWFKKMWKGKLDRMVKKLQDNGVESTPYDDKKW